MEPSPRHMVFHGFVVLLFGLLCRRPLCARHQQGAPVRIVHASLPTGAILMVAVLSSFAEAPAVKRLIITSLVASSYVFCLPLPQAAIVGHRGLSSEGPTSASLVYASLILL